MTTLKSEKRKFNYLQHRKFILIFFILGTIFIFYLPAFSQTVGNIFFGKVPVLYNIKFAQFFFNQSAYPVLGKPEPYAHYQLSRIYFIQGKLKSAVSEAKKELEIYPKNTRTYYILGLTYGYLNQEELAIENFSKFIEHNPMSWAARNDKAWLQFRIGDIEAALSTLEPVAHDIDNPWVQNTYGTLLLNQKEYSGAKQAYLNAKRVTDTMTEKSWGNAYPGNDPRIYAVGLSAMKKSIANNLYLLEEEP